MQESTSREKVLKAIRDALVNPMHLQGEREDYADTIYTRKNEEFIEVCFAESLAEANAGFIYNSNIQELIQNLSSLLQSREINNLFCFDTEIQSILQKGEIDYFDQNDQYKCCEAAITSCEFLIARLGSIMVSSAQGWGRKGIIYPPVQIVVATRDQLVYDIHHAFDALKKKYPHGIPSMVSLVTGPSRTADIEKTLVLGAHGPESLYVCLLDSTQEDE